MLMAPGGRPPARFVVTDRAGTVVLHGRVPATSRRRAGTAGYPDVYRLDLSRLHEPGRYRVSDRPQVAATSPWFRVMGAGPPVRDPAQLRRLLRPEPARRAAT